MVKKSFKRKISRSLNAEKTLNEKEEKFRIIFEGASDGIIVADLKTKKFILANPEICRMTGYSLKELLKLDVADIHPKKDLPYVVSQFRKQAQGLITLAKDIPVLRKDKKVFYCNVNSKPVKLMGKDVLLGFFRDITEQKKSRDELLRAYKIRSDLIENAPFGVMTLNKKGVVEYVNPAMLMISGSDENKFMGMNLVKLPNYVKAGLSEKIKLCFKGKPFFVENVEYVSKFGDKKTVRNFTGLPIKDETGKIEKVTLFVEDITKLKEAESSMVRRTEELENFQRISIGRELVMVELKKRIKELEGQLRK